MIKRSIPLYLILLFLFNSIISYSGIVLVTNTNDAGAGSLRDAIVNVAVSGDTIRLDTSLVSSGNATITLTSGEILVRTALTIEGIMNCNDTVFISGNNNSRIFRSFTSDNLPKIVLKELAIINGRHAVQSSAILFQGTDTVVVENCFFTLNTYSGSSTIQGGTLSISQGDVSEVNNSTFSNNTSFATVNSYGGIISLSNAKNSITNCTFSNNSVTSTSSTASTGGVLRMRPGGPISNCTFVGNSASFSSGSLDGGVITSDGPVGSDPLTLTNCTFISNTVTASTLNGSIIGTTGVNTDINIQSSIFMGSGSNLINPTIDNDNGYNIFSSATATGATGPGNQFSVTTGALNLGTLQNNGGFTHTRMPGAGSVALDLGEPTDMSVAQNKPVYNGRRDVGAAENNPLTGVSSIFPNIDTICVGGTTSLSPATGGAYTSNNPSIATVNSSGLVTGVSLGTVQIEFTSDFPGCLNNSDSLTATITVGGSAAPSGTGGDTTVCGGQYFVFPSRTCGTGTIVWYDNDTAGGTAYTDSVQPATTTTYFPFCNDGSCLSPAGDSAIATVNCFPTVFSGSTWTWTGCTDTDWFNPCNWDRGSIPNTTSLVIIPPTANNPTIASGTANCFDITVQSSLGAIVNLNSGSGGIINVLKP